MSQARRFAQFNMASAHWKHEFGRYFASVTPDFLHFAKYVHPVRSLRLVSLFGANHAREPRSLALFQKANMSQMMEQLGAWALSLALATSMLVAWGAGWQRQRRLPSDQGIDPGIKFTDAGMALLGLLLGFTFSMSLGRHEQRRAMAVAESNAIGDFYTCASLLKERHRTKLQHMIRAYVQIRLTLAHGASTEDDLESALQASQELHARMTEVVAEAVADGTPVAVVLANTINGVTSSQAARLAAYRDRLPWSVVVLLFVAAVVPAFLMGQQQGVSQRPHLSGTLSFVLLVTLVTYVTLDLNLPASGLIRVSQEPMERLATSLSK